MSEKIVPLHDRVIVEVLDERTTSGGIVIPENAEGKSQKGIIRAAGPGKVLENGNVNALTVKVGDEVLFSKYAGTELKLDGKSFLVMSETDIVGIIKK